MKQQHSNTATTRRCCCHCHCHCCRSNSTTITTNTTTTSTNSILNTNNKKKIYNNNDNNKYKTKERHKNQEIQQLGSTSWCGLHINSSSSHTYSWLLVMLLIAVCVVNVSPEPELSAVMFYTSSTTKTTPTDLSTSSFTMRRTKATENTTHMETSKRNKVEPNFKQMNAHVTNPVAAEMLSIMMELSTTTRTRRKVSTMTKVRDAATIIHTKRTEMMEEHNEKQKMEKNSTTMKPQNKNLSVSKTTKNPQIEQKIPTNVESLHKQNQRNKQQQQEQENELQTTARELIIIAGKNERKEAERRQHFKHPYYREYTLSTEASQQHMSATVPHYWSRAQSYYNIMHGWQNVAEQKNDNIPKLWSTSGPYTSDAAIDHFDRPPHTRTLARYSREVSQEQIDRCRMFVEGDPVKYEFYSPDFPNEYPKNINCTRVIEAPQGQIIRLDFRNSFHIEEKEDCKFDFLEIRDGAYGFSNEIGRYCGTNFPPEITSKERYLWLHFHSDESIEYSGFTAVYEFIDRNREAPSTDLNCTIPKDGFEGWINSSDVPEDKMETIIKTKIPLDCMWRIQVADNWRIQLKFFDFKLAKPNYCSVNFLDIFPEETIMPLRVKNFCGSAGESITSDSNILHIRYYAEPVAINSTVFNILFTAFRDRGTGSCTENEFDCEDATCISNELKCNKRDNCKFRWDEEGCESESKGQSEHVIIIVTVFGLILGGMVVTFLVNCVRKIMRDQKIIREHIRQSKESKLDEIERNSKASSKARSRDNISVAMSPRQKHSETSLQILDDVSNRFYQDAIALTTLPQKGDFKEKEHTILRQYHDMVVQTSLCSATDDNSSSTTTAEVTPQILESHGSQHGGKTVMACDMGCQTRESLFAPVLMRQKSISSSIGGVPPPPRFSTFGYEVPPPPPPATSRPGQHQRQLSQHQQQHSLHYADYDDGTLRYSPTIQQQQQLQQQQQQQQQQFQQQKQTQKQCHHHHQHQQHLQQQQQLKLNINNQATTTPTATTTILPQQRQQHAHAHHQHQHQHQHHHVQQQEQPLEQKVMHKHMHSHMAANQPHFQSQAIIGISGISKSSSSNSTAAPSPITTSKTTLPTTANTTATSMGESGGNHTKKKADESKIFIDIRNSAPDVIIMTSH